MIYAIAIAFLVGMGMGSIGQHKIDRAEILSLKHAIERGNAEAEAALNVAKQKVAASEAQAAQANQLIEKNHEATIVTISTLNDELRKRAASRPNPVSKCASADVVEDSAVPADLSERVVDMAFRADQVAAYAQACWEFVKTDCGTKP